MQSSNHIDRRTVLKGAMAFAAMAGLGEAPARAAGNLRVMTWEGYSDDQWVKRFEGQSGASVSISYIGSGDEEFARAVASKGADFDIVTPDISAVRHYVDQGLLLPIDASKIPNLAKLLPNLQNLPGLQTGGKTYGVPFAWGSLPMVYRTSAFPQPPNSWGVFWDPANKGKVLIQDDANNNVSWAAIALGFKDPYRLSDEQFAAVKQKLIELKRNALTFYTGLDDGASLFVQGNVELLFPMGQAQSALIRKKGVDVHETVPVEGASGWIDCWAISAATPDVDLAHAWINAMLEMDVGAYQTTQYGVASAVNAQANKNIGMDYADKLKWMEAPEDYNKRVQLWNEVKATP